MIGRARSYVCVLAAFGWGVCGLAQAQVSEAQNKLLARRAAEADCYRKLAETVYGVQINSETYVKDFVTESDTIRTAVDAFIKGIRLGEARYYEDGACEVDAEITVEKLITTLKEIHKAHYEGNRVTTSDFEQISKRINKDVIQVTGMGAPRPELPPDLPAGVEDVITPLPPDYTPPRELAVPGIWKSVPPQARLMAKRAAQVDAQRKLLEQILGVRLTSETLVRDFVTGSDEIATQASGIVVGAVERETYYHDDELIVEVTYAVPVERVVTTIKQLHSEHYHGNKITTQDIETIKKRLERSEILATGSGVPPAKFFEQAVSAGYQVPNWMAETIEATGQGAIDTSNPNAAQARLMGIRAAEADAYRALAELIYGLQIDSSTTVKDFITQHDDINTQVNAVIAGAVFSTPEIADNVVTVKASVPAAEVWRVIHGEMQVVQRQGG